MNETINKPLHWLIASSADPTKVSLMIKGLTVAIPSIVVFFALIGHPISSDYLTALIQELAAAATAVLTAISAVVAAYGAGRKIYYAITQKSS